MRGDYGMAIARVVTGISSRLFARCTVSSCRSCALFVDVYVTRQRTVVSDVTRALWLLVVFSPVAKHRSTAAPSLQARVAPLACAVGRRVVQLEAHASGESAASGGGRDDDLVLREDELPSRHLGRDLADDHLLAERVAGGVVVVLPTLFGSPAAGMYCACQ